MIISDEFDELFFSSIDAVVTALDNVPDRIYVDSRIITFRKPLVDAGTVSTKASTQVLKLVFIP